LVCTLLVAPELRAKSEPRLEEKPDHLKTKFFKRTYMSETKALRLQKKSSSDRVKQRTITLDREEINQLQSGQRVGVFTKELRVQELYESGESKPYRYVIPIKQPGQHEYMDLMYGVNTDGTIHRIDLMVYREPHGMEIKSRRFMEQFEGRSLKSSEFQVNQDVVHIAGATISSKSTARGARKVLAILNMKGIIESDRSSGSDSPWT